MSGQLRMTTGVVGDLGIDRGELLGRVRRLHKLYREGALGGTTHEVFPRVPPGSRERYLYFTLAPALNFQRRSEALWHAALQTYSDDRTRFVFFPENVTRGVEEYRAALLRYGLALQPEKHTRIWFTVSSTLDSRFEADPRVFVAEHGGDVLGMRDTLYGNKGEWPYLSGPKLSNYWLYMLVSFTDVRLRNRGSISIIPDVHVRRATQRLGLSDGLPGATEAAELWDSFLAGTDLAPCDLHAPLWRWARGGFELAV